MGRFTGKNILVVGGSSGIGLELARRLLAGGTGLTIWSRTEPSGLGPGSYTHCPVDVRRSIPEQNPHCPEALHGLAFGSTPWPLR